MKSGIITTLSGLALIMATIAIAQVRNVTDVPRFIDFQGYLKNPGGGPVNATVNLTFRIFDNADGTGTARWTENHLGVVVDDGLFTVFLGSIDPVGNPLKVGVDDDFDFTVNGASNRWLQVVVDGDPLVPLQPFLSVPYAFLAGDARTLDGMLVADRAAGNVQAWNNIDMNANDIIDVDQIQVNRGAADNRVLASDPTGFGTWKDSKDVEVDPQVGANTLNRVPSWDGDELVTGTIFDDRASGRIGIGTDTPDARLDVDGQVRIRGGDPADGRVLVSDANGLASWRSAASVETDPQVHDVMTNNYVPRWNATNLVGGTIFDDGDIGIGTDDPTARLDVNGQVRIRGGNPAANRVLTSSDADGNGTWTNIALLETDPQVDDTLPNNSVPRWDGDDLTRGSITNLANGDVGIGTNPAARLDVNGNAIIRGPLNMNANVVSNVYVIQVLSNAAVGRVLTSDANGTGSWQNIAFLERDPQVHDVMTNFYVPRWWDTNLVGGTIFDDGDIGIGTDDPAARLDVNGNAIIRGPRNMNANVVSNVYVIQVLSNAAAGRVLTSDANGTGSWQNIAFLERDPQVHDVMTNNYVPRWNATNLVGGTIYDNGNIGIGITAPGARLDVDGQVWIRGGDPDDGEVLVSDANGLASWRAAVSVETDPQVHDVMTNNYVPRWNATNLVGGTIYDNGNIGIGVTAPGARLDVDGQIRIRGGGPGDREVLMSDANGLASWENIALLERDPQVDDTLASNAVPRWNGTNLMSGSIYNLTNGNVGIGTTNPLYKLDVNGNAALTEGLSLRQSGYDGSANNNKTADITHNGARLKIRMGGANGRVPIDFSMQDTPALYISPDPFVGVGTTNPLVRLDVRVGADQHVGIREAGSISSIGAFNDAGNTYVPLGIDASALSLQFRSGGNVGIRTTNPSSPLHLRQPDNYRDYGLYIQRAGSDYGAVMYMDTGGGVRIGTKSDAGINYDDDYIFLGTGSGNVGVGTPSPAAKLDVNGSIVIANFHSINNNYPGSMWASITPLSNLIQNHMGDWANVTLLKTPLGGLYVRRSAALGFSDIYLMELYGGNGSLWIAGGYSSGSDSRIKINQRKLEYGLPQVMALEPKRYDRVDYEYDPETEEIVVHPEKITSTNEIGLVAQDVQAAIPEAVTVPQDENSGLWSISYDAIIP
ncbi:MAG: tail fiber domain-containing protein, partial [Lentisphaerae bacterium]|nr:tail fiber domain-containing protein [Lentisphaerota bacterium]